MRERGPVHPHRTPPLSRRTELSDEVDPRRSLVVDTGAVGESVQLLVDVGARVGCGDVDQQVEGDVEALGGDDVREPGGEEVDGALDLTEHVLPGGVHHLLHLRLEEGAVGEAGQRGGKGEREG